MSMVHPCTHRANHRANHLLAALSPADYSLLAPHLKQIPLDQGVLLHERGEQITQVYFPQSGMISLVVVMENGAAVETATIGCEGVVGAMSALGGRRASGRAIVQLEGAASRIAAAQLHAAVRQSATLQDLIGHYNGALMAMISQSAGCNALHQIEARLCRRLLQTRDRCGTAGLPLTQEFLAEILAVRRTTLTMTARALQARGVIKYSRGRIEIVDPDQLERNACECYASTRRILQEMFSSLTK